jgi:hypothetical protein
MGDKPSKGKSLMTSHLPPKAPPGHARRGKKVVYEEDDMSGGPDWLPEGVLTFIDFKNSHYYYGGAEHTRAETVEENAEWGPFAIANIVDGVGLSVTGTADDFSGSFVLSAGAKSGLLPSSGGFTAVMTFSLSASGNSATSNIIIEALDLPDYNLEWSIARSRIGANDVAGSDDGGSNSDTRPASGNKFVVTMTPGRLAMCWPSSGVFSYDNPPNNSAATDIAVQACIYNFIDGGTATSVLESVAFYAPRDDAGMLALVA